MFNGHLSFLSQFVFDLVVVWLITNTILKLVRVAIKNQYLLFVNRFLKRV